MEIARQYIPNGYMYVITILSGLYHNQGSTLSRLLKPDTNFSDLEIIVNSPR